VKTKHRPIRPNDRHPYELTAQGNVEAWFYTARRSVHLVLSETGRRGIVYRLRVRDMERIVKALKVKP
jgi:hypothetical protein